MKDHLNEELKESDDVEAEREENDEEDEEPAVHHVKWLRSKKNKYYLNY